ncbi:hypothetical protein IFR04_014211 [Cadophora malorum]|uniref:Uncharacterized protein n=1 Tax=Cadophora malorum TaxID=108018 RepID=A0A8H7T558_9HELO|nr:hypothetical protein IFR04_014211 [Cadophora malorum]
MLSPLVSQRILYASAGLSAFAIFKHTQLAFTELFPRLDRGTGIERLALFAVKSNFLQVGAAWAFIGMLQLKWARFGLHGVYDKAILGWYAISSFAFGLAYLREGVYVPLVPIWLIPALTALSQL